MKSHAWNWIFHRNKVIPANLDLGMDKFMKNIE